MTRRSEILDCTAASAQAALNLYFEPLRGLRPLRPLFADAGGLSGLGRALAGSISIALLLSMMWAQLFTEAAARRRVNDLLNALFAQTAEAAMTTPKSPTQQPRAPTTGSVQISQPANHALVPTMEQLRGKASADARAVWVVVHPLDTSSYWVQPKVSLGTDGAWSGLAYWGRAGAVDSGRRFEVRAIVDPKIDLREGAILDSWPDAEAVSEPVIVERK
jgi:hypothetical protein